MLILGAPLQLWENVPVTSPQPELLTCFHVYAKFCPHHPNHPDLAIFFQFIIQYLASLCEFVASVSRSGWSGAGCVLLPRGLPCSQMLFCTSWLPELLLTLCRRSCRFTSSSHRSAAARGSASLDKHLKVLNLECVRNANLFSGCFCGRLRCNWGTVQVLTWMFQHKEQHKARRKKPAIEYWFLFLSPLFLCVFYFFLSHAPLEADSSWWNGPLWSALPHRAATLHCPTVILGTLQGHRWELLKKAQRLFFLLLLLPVKSISKVFAVFWGEQGFSALLSLMKTIFMARSIM